MKLTKNKWLNLAVLKIAEGLGIVFIPYLVGSIPLLIWPVLADKHYFESALDVWSVGFVLIFTPIIIIGLIWAIVCLNLDWAKSLKRDK